MRTSLDDILGTDVDDGATDGLCRVDHEVVVLSDLEDAELGLLVDDTLINGISDSIVDQLAVKQKQQQQNNNIVVIVVI